MKRILPKLNLHSRLALIPLLDQLDRLGCKSNGRTHFLLGKNIDCSLYRIHVAVQRRRGYGGVVAARCSGRCRVAGDVRSTTAWRKGGGLPVASVPRVDRVATRVFSGVIEWRRTSSIEPLTPPLSFIWHCAMGAHQPCWAGRPRSGRKSRAQLAVGPTGGDQSNIFNRYL